MGKQVIVESALVTATTTDLLNSSRLQTVPAGGFLTIELISSASDASNNFLATVQMPNGITPLNSVLVPGSNPALAGVMDDRQKLMITLPIEQGGHCVISLAETGTAVLMYRVTYSGPPIG